RLGNPVHEQVAHGGDVSRRNPARPTRRAERVDRAVNGVGISAHEPRQDPVPATPRGTRPANSRRDSHRIGSDHSLTKMAAAGKLLTSPPRLRLVLVMIDSPAQCPAPARAGAPAAGLAGVVPSSFGIRMA